MNAHPGKTFKKSAPETSPRNQPKISAPANQPKAPAHDISEGDILIKYFFTVTLHRDLLLKPVKTQLLKSYGPLFTTCRNIFHHFEMVYEFTKGCNIHYHGITRVFKDDQHLMYCFQDILRGFPYGFHKVDEIKTDNGVDQYLIKDIELTKKVCNRLKIDLDHYPIIVNQESRVKKEKYRLIPLPVTTTIKLDKIPTIYEVCDDDDLDQERDFMLYNYQLK